MQNIVKDFELSCGPLGPLRCLVQSGVCSSLSPFVCLLTLARFVTKNQNDFRFGQTLGICLISWSLWPSFSALWVKVHFSIMTIWKMEMAISHHLFDLQVYDMFIGTLLWLYQQWPGPTFEGHRGKYLK